MAQPGIKYFLCGGTAINIGLALIANAHTAQNKTASFVGFDSSDANNPQDKFVVEHMPKAAGSDEKARGSGKMKITNYEASENFIKQQMAKHKGADYNVIIAHTSGGTGSLLWTHVLRELVKQDLPVVVYFINQFTSTAEMRNSVGTIRTAINQTAKNMLNAPICFISSDNTQNNTRGEVNEQIVDRLNLLSLFMTEENGEMDYTDFKNFLYYNRVTSIPPALSQITFYDQETAKDFKGKTPVAVASLFDNSDSVVPMFVGTTYSTTGIFPADTKKPKAMTQLHMCLDHGEALKALEERIDALDEETNKVVGTYTQQKDMSSNADSNGIEL